MLMDSWQQTKYSYLVVAVGVALMTIAVAFEEARAVIFVAAFRPRAGFGGVRPFVAPTPFGLTNGLTILAVIVAILGLVWLGFALRKSAKDTAH
jgi:hypothetical protein